MSRNRVHLAIGFEYHKQSFDPLIPVFAKHGVEASYDYDGQEVAVLADPGCRILTKAGFQFNLGHGVGSKNCFWVGNERDRGLIHLVPSQYYVDRFRTFSIETEVVGIPKLDSVFRGKKDSIYFRILYAPTFHDGITSAYEIGGRIYELDKPGEVGVNVKLHPFLRVEGIQKISAGLPDADSLFPRQVFGGIAEHFKWADLVIGDYSSIPIEATICGIPSIIYEPDGYIGGLFYDEENIEVKFSGGSYIVKSFDEIPPIVERLRNGDDPLKDERERLAAMLCDYKGKAAERVYKVLNGYYHFGGR